jgi:hypothetical protein
MYFDPSSAITSGIEVIATFCSSPVTSAAQSCRCCLSAAVSATGNEMAFSPNPCGMMSATGTSPAFTAASAVSAVYSGCSTPCWGAGRNLTVILIHCEDVHLRRRVTASAKDDNKDRKESDRQNETQG